MHRREVPVRRRKWMSFARGLVLVGVLVALVSTTALSTGLRAPPAAGPRSASVAVAPVAPSPASGSTFNPPCASVTPFVCVSLDYPGEPNIIPSGGNSSASVSPSASQSLPLIVKSKTGINWTGSPISGPNCPVAINITANLWNGAPYYTQADGSTWHSSTAQWYIGPLPGVTNKTYPYWYLVNITATGTGNQPQFQPGMTVSWWIALTYNTSGVIQHVGNVPVWHYTYSGAWPYSPYAGSGHPAGNAAFGQDLELTQQPSQPNWNDSVHLMLATNAADRANNATIGTALVRVNATGPNLGSLGSADYNFSLGVTATTGATSVPFVIPASFALVPGATVRYQVSATDFWGDSILSKTYTYTVGGNGSFASGYFSTDLSLTTFPVVGGTDLNWSGTLLSPGTPISLTLVSRNSPDAINQAEVVYTVEIPQLGTTVTRSAAFVRVNSTEFLGTLPGMPIGAQVNYTVLAWDFTSHLEVASGWNYSVATFGDLVPTVPGNQSFFYVGVYDAGNGHWVNGANVTIRTLGGYVHTTGTTFDGLAYPNATKALYVPLVVPANATYLINVTDPTYFPTGTVGSPTVTLTLVLSHAMTGHIVLASGATYSVVQQGNLILFWLNGTLPSPTAAPSETTLFEVGAVLGLVAATATIIPLYAWWRRIESRREAELKRVTL
jgi:hypothetical protein